MADSSRRSTRFSMRSKQLGQLLLENGDVQAEQVAEALKLQEQQGGLVGQILAQMGACSGQSVGAALLKQVQVTDIQCEELQVSPDVAGLVPRELCEAEKLCPFERLGNLLCVVMGNPLNRKAISQIEEKTRLKVKSFKSVWPKISELIQRSYSGEGGALAEVPAMEEGGIAISDDGVAPLDLPPLVSDDAGAALPETTEPVFDSPVVDLEMPAEPAAPIPIPAAPAPMAFVPPPAPRRKSGPIAPVAPKIQGIDDLDDSKAELIATDQRGMVSRRSRQVEEAPKPKPVKQAKVNVDLDAMDFSGGEVVGAAADSDEAMQEIAAPAPGASLRPAHVLVLKTVGDNYFYDGQPPSGLRSEEFLKLIESLPVAAVVAESIGDYNAKQKQTVSAAAPAKVAASAAARPIELQPCPAGVMAAVGISESEFQKQVASLGEDPVGEWDWQYANAGPVAVEAYEEN